MLFNNPLRVVSNLPLLLLNLPLQLQKRGAETHLQGLSLRGSRGFDGPLRYRESSRFEMMPSRPNRQACSNTAGPSCARWVSLQSTAATFRLDADCQCSRARMCQAAAVRGRRARRHNRRIGGALLALRASGHYGSLFGILTHLNSNVITPRWRALRVWLKSKNPAWPEAVNSPERFLGSRPDVFGTGSMEHCLDGNPLLGTHVPITSDPETHKR
jgi:hypothetical protein